MRIKVADVARVRRELLLAQGGRCAICLQPCTEAQAVLDHCHATGAIRAALHRACNSVLGKVENGCVRYCVKDIHSFCNGLSPYLRVHMVNTTGLLHPSFRTPDEKRLKRNAKARKTRAANKGLTDDE